MDSLRSFEGGSESDRDYPARDEPEMDTPPSIGTDERRMHVRAYNYWVSLLGDRTYPSVEDLDPANMQDFGPHSVLLDFTAGAENPGISFLGKALRIECELSADIRNIAEVPSRSLLSRLTDHYLQIIANRAPIGFEAEFVSQRGLNTLYRGILMPFSSDDDTIDFIYGVINWKELADPHTATELEVEIDKAMRDAATPVLPGPVWADGPLADPIEVGLPVHAETLTVEEAGVVPPTAGGNLGLARNLDDGFASLAPAPALVTDEDLPAVAGNAGLGDILAAARETAEILKGADARSRVALYRALGLAYDFARAAEGDPEDYAELLADAGIRAQARAPMTPVVKLVFGVDYDKTRLTEFATVLAHARRHDLQPGTLTENLEAQPGGLKAIVQVEREARRPFPRPSTGEAARAALRRASAQAIIDLPSGNAEFVLLVARREPDGRLAVLTPVPNDERLLDRAMHAIAR